MAEYAHTPDRRSPKTATPLAGRRRLGAALLAVGAGSLLTSGIAAGAAASVADLAPRDTDAELIGLCDEFISLEQARYVIFDGPDAVSSDYEAARAAIPLETRMNALVDEMQAPRAATAAGIVARAQALAAHNGNFGFSFDDPDDTNAGRMLSFLLRDAVGLGGPDLARIIAFPMVGGA